jgi:hypothetical protein
MLADLVMMAGDYPYSVIAAIALVCAAAVWKGTR